MTSFVVMDRDLLLAMAACHDARDEIEALRRARDDDPRIADVVARSIAAPATGQRHASRGVR